MVYIKIRKGTQFALKIAFKINNAQAIGINKILRNKANDNFFNHYGN